MPTPPTAFRRRRDRVLKALGHSVGLVLAGDGAPPLSGFWQADAFFAYLTGITDEAGAAVLFDPGAEDPRRCAILFLKPLNPEAEAWDGYRDPISASLKQRHGFETVLRTTLLPRVLTAAARRSKRLACLHPFAVYDAPLSPDLALFRKVCERIPGCTAEDRTALLPSLRAVKDAGEIDAIRNAIDATSAGYAAAARAIRPGATETDVHRAFESACAGAGALGSAYNPIVGAGLNSTVLHYMANTAPIGAGDLVLIDAGAAWGRRGLAYAADVTRTFPASGRFTPRQREVYGLVLRAQEAAVRAVRPGVFLHEIDQAARAVFRRAGVEDKYIHGIGHHLGLEVHDANPDGPLAPGMVITVEPGLYFPEEKLGVRIEDDVLVTPKGRENLSARIPKSIEEIESLMAGRRSRAGPPRRAPGRRTPAGR